MSAVVKSANAGYDAISAMNCVNISELLSANNTAGKFAKLDPVYIDSDGRVTAAIDSTLAVNFDGFSMSASDSDGAMPVTIKGLGLIMEWLEDSDAYTPGTLFYVGAANQLETTGRQAVAMAISATEIIVIAPPGIRLGNA